MCFRRVRKRVPRGKRDDQRGRAQKGWFEATALEKTPVVAIDLFHSWLTLVWGVFQMLLRIDLFHSWLTVTWGVWIAQSAKTTEGNADGCRDNKKTKPPPQPLAPKQHQTTSHTHFYLHLT